MLAEARQSGAGFMVLYGLHRLAFSQLLGGEWAVVRAGAEEAVALSHAVGERGLAASPMAWLTLLAALQGRSDYAERLAEVQEIAASHRLGILTVPVRDLVHWAEATKAAADTDHVGALVHLRQVATPALQRMTVLDRITAAVRVGELEAAASWLSEFEDFAAATGWPWAETVLNHSKALLAEADAAPEYYVAALKVTGANVRPFDLARTNLALGEHLRRSQRRTDARPYLRAAVAQFDDLGAEPFSMRAANELRASGETARKRDPSTALDLTPMELQTAQLGAEGLSNKEIAAQLWISPRTVAFHLRNVFTKTGISSRSELVRLDLS
jgi:DNA-binding CsgD family transcriptional regulator